MGKRFRLRWAPDVSDDMRRAAREALSGEAGQFLPLAGYARQVKQVGRVDTAAGPLLVKRRRYAGLLRRLGRTVRRTKADREFGNLVALARLGVPCPRPVAVGRRFGGLLVKESLLAEEYLADASPVGTLLDDPDAEARGRLLDALVEFLGVLHRRGVVHRDLHGDNLLAQPSPTGFAVYVVDALHVRFVRPPADRAFARSVQWFLAFLVCRRGTDNVIAEFLDRVPRLGLRELADRGKLLARAGAVAEKLSARERRNRTRRT